MPATPQSGRLEGGPHWECSQAAPSGRRPLQPLAREHYEQARLATWEGYMPLERPSEPDLQVVQVDAVVGAARGQVLPRCRQALDHSLVCRVCEAARQRCGGAALRRRTVAGGGARWRAVARGFTG